jgi:hypothetical protein
MNLRSIAMATNLRPLRADKGSAAGVTIATLGRPDSELASRIGGGCGTSRMMVAARHGFGSRYQGFAHAMIGHRRHCHGTRKRRERSRKQDKQHQSGDQTLHIGRRKEFALSDHPKIRSPAESSATAAGTW